MKQRPITYLILLYTILPLLIKEASLFTPCTGDKQFTHCKSTEEGECVDTRNLPDPVCVALFDGGSTEDYSCVTVHEEDDIYIYPSPYNRMCLNFTSQYAGCRDPDTYFFTQDEFFVRTSSSNYACVRIDPLECIYIDMVPTTFNKETMVQTPVSCLLRDTFDAYKMGLVPDMPYLAERTSESLCKLSTNKELTVIQGTDYYQDVNTGECVTLGANQCFDTGDEAVEELNGRFRLSVSNICFSVNPVECDPGKCLSEDHNFCRIPYEDECIAEDGECIIFQGGIKGFMCKNEEGNCMFFKDSGSLLTARPSLLDYSCTELTESQCRDPLYGHGITFSSADGYYCRHPTTNICVSQKMINAMDLLFHIDSAQQFCQGWAGGGVPNAGGGHPSTEDPNTGEGDPTEEDEVDIDIDETGNKIDQSKEDSEQEDDKMKDGVIAGIVLGSATGVGLLGLAGWVLYKKLFLPRVIYIYIYIYTLFI